MVVNYACFVCTEGSFDFPLLSVNFIDCSIDDYDNLDRYISDTGEYIQFSFSALHFSKVNITDWYYLIEIILAM
jgi:hypothetical protein